MRVTCGTVARMPGENAPAVATTDITQQNGQAPAPAGAPPPTNPSPPDASKLFAQHMAAKRAAQQLPPAQPPQPPPGAGQAAPEGAGSTQEPAKDAAEPGKGSAEQPDKPAKDQQAGELELQLGRALRTIQQRDTELATLRKEAGNGGKAAKALTDLRTRAKDPAQLLDVVHELSGYTFPELVDAINGDVVKPHKGARYANLPPDVAERLEQQEKDLAEMKREREQQADQAAFQRDIGIASGYLKENADEFPLLAEMDWAPSVIVNTTRQKGDGNGHAVAVALERSLRANFERFLGSDRAVDALIKSNEKLKERLSSRFGGGQPAVSNGRGSGGGNGAPSLGSVSSERALAGPDSRSRDEIDRHAHEALEQRMAAKRRGEIV